MAWSISSESLLESDLLNEESLFFSGNGYLGVRGNFEEGLPNALASIRGTYINAYHDIVSIEYGEKLYGFPETQQKLLNIIDAQSLYLIFDDEKFSLFEGEVLSYKRGLYLDKGYTERSIHWRSPNGKEVKICFQRLVSFIHKELFIQKVIIEPMNYFGPVSIISTLNGDVTNFTDKNDPRVSSGHAKRLKVTNCSQFDMVSYVEVETYQSKLKAACSTTYSVNGKFELSDVVKEGFIETIFQGELTETIILEKKSIFVDTLRHGNKLLETAKELNLCLSASSFDDLLEQQTNYLQHFWIDTDVEIKGDSSLLEGLRFNLFSLLQSAGRDQVSNIAAKGLSGEGYEGHYFWDTEIYMTPVFLMSNPEIAKQLLIYRHSILESARSHAKIMGHSKGALYPWRTISGTECSSYFPSGSAQYHISADIAYSYIQYYMVTQDFDFLKQYGAEVLFETARLWLEVGHMKNDLFRIEAITGPDEYTCVVNNNYYTNAMAKHNLIWAKKVYGQLQMSSPDCLAELREKINLTEEEVLAWSEAAEKMYLPYDEKLKINPQDDSFLNKDVWDLENTPRDKFPLLLHYHPLKLYRYQVCKQADTVLAHFLLEDEQNVETMKNSYDYYEKVTTHDSSLSSCVFSIMAAKLGYKEKAYDYFIETARLDLDNTHGNTKDGLHMANMGGTWMAIIFGFAGLRIKEGGISLNPILPTQWEGYSFPLKYQGRRLFVSVTPEETSIELLSGEDLSISVFGEDFTASLNESIILS